MRLSHIEEALIDFREGKFLIVVDSEDRENEGDLIIAASSVTPEAINFMAREARGLICLAMTGTRLDALNLPLMVPPTQSTARFGTAFTVSVEARYGVTTGISAYDRATTIRALIDPATGEEAITRPGHIFPLRAAENGVLTRAGHTEAAVDLARLAGVYPAGAICEIMNEDGTMARLENLEVFAAKHGIKMISIADLIAYRSHHEQLVYRQAETLLPTEVGEFRVLAYEDHLNHQTHLALIFGLLSGNNSLVRLHSECLTGDALGSQRCDCGPQLIEAKRRIADEGSGVLLYLRQEGRGIGLLNKLHAYALQDQGLDTVEANEHLGFPDDLRRYECAAQILNDLGLDRIRLLTNNPRKVAGLEQNGITVTERVPLVIPAIPTNQHYLAVKRQKLGHFLPVPDRGL